MKTLILITRHGCHLCEDMQEALADVPVALDIRDVDADPELYRLYNDKVPVLMDGDIELCRYFFEPLTVQKHLDYI